MCDYQVEVDDIFLGGSAIYVTNSMCVDHSKKLLKYSFASTTDTMFDVESFRKDELNKFMTITGQSENVAKIMMKKIKDAK